MLLMIKISNDFEVNVKQIQLAANCLYDISIDTNKDLRSIYTGFGKNDSCLIKCSLKTKKLDLFSGHTRSVYTVAHSKGVCKLLATGSYDKSLIFYNSSTHKIKGKRLSISQNYTSNLLFVENERLLFVGTCDNCCFIFCTKTLESRQRIDVSIPVYTLCVSDQYLFFAGSGKKVYFIRLK